MNQINYWLYIIPTITILCLLLGQYWTSLANASNNESDQARMVIHRAMCMEIAVVRVPTG